MEDGKSDMFSYACGDGDVWGNFFHFGGFFWHGKKFEVNLHLDVFTAAAAADLKDNYFYTRTKTAVLKSAFQKEF